MPLDLTCDPACRGLGHGGEAIRFFGPRRKYASTPYDSGGSQQQAIAAIHVTLPPNSLIADVGEYAPGWGTDVDHVA